MILTLKQCYVVVKIGNIMDQLKCNLHPQMIISSYGEDLNLLSLYSLHWIRDLSKGGDYATWLNHKTTYGINLILELNIIP